MTKYLYNVIRGTNMFSSTGIIGSKKRAMKNQSQQKVPSNSVSYDTRVASEILSAWKRKSAGETSHIDTINPKRSNHAKRQNCMKRTK